MVRSIPSEAFTRKNFWEYFLQHDEQVPYNFHLSLYFSNVVNLSMLSLNTRHCNYDYFLSYHDSQFYWLRDFGNFISVKCTERVGLLGTHKIRESVCSRFSPVLKIIILLGSLFLSFFCFWVFSIQKKFQVFSKGIIFPLSFIRNLYWVTFYRILTIKNLLCLAVLSLGKTISKISWGSCQRRM